jgi:hypothetical protein
MIALDPSLDAQLALASFLWAADRAPETEAILKQILAKEPQHDLANRMLAVSMSPLGGPTRRSSH